MFIWVGDYQPLGVQYPRVDIHHVGRFSVHVDQDIELARLELSGLDQKMIHVVGVTRLGWNGGGKRAWKVCGRGGGVRQCYCVWEGAVVGGGVDRYGAGRSCGGVYWGVWRGHWGVWRGLG